jgi:hypothetical protein
MMRRLGIVLTVAGTLAAMTVITVGMKDGSRVTVATFSGPVTYVLHDGRPDRRVAQLSITRPRSSLRLRFSVL